MQRRNFLRMMVGGIVTAAAVRTFPFRVFSFPREIEPIYHIVWDQFPLITPNDAQFIEIRSFNRAEIARMFRIPLTLMPPAPLLESLPPGVD